MGRAKTIAKALSIGPYKCHICSRRLSSKFVKDAQDWDWFTGYLPETVHFCPVHKDSQEAKRLYKQSQTKYTQKEIQDGNL